MDNLKIPYQDLRFYSNIIKDYLDRKDEVRPLYHRFPTLHNFEAQIQEKQAEWKEASPKRESLVEVLRDQYQNLPEQEHVTSNIDLLSRENTFTVTTGHQLNLFTGPLYFLYKIASNINLCRKLKETYSDKNFVPIFWMATEDHDFEEVQYFNFGDRKIVYDREAGGAVGRLDNSGLDKVYDSFETLLGNHEHAKKLKELFENAYLDHKNLADATRYIAHELFGQEGLVVLDADDARLKQHATGHFEQDLLDHLAFEKVNETIDVFPPEYKVQVNPREINLFYLTDEHRGRIIFKDDKYFVDGGDLAFAKADLLKELHDHPERFSPNVILRPLYQEIVLPNLCYIGGGGEMAYWLELKSFFEASKITFPILLLRNSAQLATSKELDKLSRLKLLPADLFQEEFELEEQVTRQISHINIDFEPQKQHLKNQFADLYDLAEKTEKSFKTAVAAQEQKQINGLEHLEKRLLKAQKRKLADEVERSLKLQKEWLPNGGLQERVTNFSYFYQNYGSDLIDKILEGLDPLDLRFTVIKID